MLNTIADCQDAPPKTKKDDKNQKSNYYKFGFGIVLCIVAAVILAAVALYVSQNNNVIKCADNQIKLGNGTCKNCTTYTRP